MLRQAIVWLLALALLFTIGACVLAVVQDTCDPHPRLGISRVFKSGDINRPRPGAPQSDLYSR